MFLVVWQDPAVVYNVVKKKYWVQQSVKEVMLTIFWNMKDPITTDFFGKCADVNIAPYCLIFWQNSPYLLNDLYIYKSAKY